MIVSASDEEMGTMVLTDDVNVELLLSHFECFLSEIVSKLDRTRSRAGKRRWRRRSRGRWREMGRRQCAQWRWEEVWTYLVVVEGGRVRDERKMRVERKMDAHRRPLFIVL